MKRQVFILYLTVSMKSGHTVEHRTACHCISVQFSNFMLVQFLTRNRLRHVDPHEWPLSLSKIWLKSRLFCLLCLIAA